MMTEGLNLLGVLDLLNTVKWNTPSKGKYVFDLSTTLQSIETDKDSLKPILEFLKDDNFKVFIMKQAAIEFKKNIRFDLRSYSTDKIASEIIQEFHDALSTKRKEMNIPVRCCTEERCPEFKYRLYVLEKSCHALVLPIPQFKVITNN